MTTDAISRHNALSDDEFLTQFEECRLDPSLFNHVGHLRAAFLMLQRQPMLIAQKHYSMSLLRYATHLNAPEKYHATITYAVLAIIAARQGVQRCADWRAFIRQNTDMVSNAKGLLAQYYQEETLQSREARLQFVLPDKTTLADMIGAPKKHSETTVS